ncbi:MAG: fibrobacter succinogenes major paralogous domain-containing protein [Flavobacteriaceae bacterium]|jgi:uncharacterized protein (TIGR02145 family)|nr:fibrobacter succinogenes major paralogous domain-containing protein [Flavobacteriaceae bacterium]
MKRVYFILLMTVLCAFSVEAQVAIGASEPKRGTILDLNPGGKPNRTRGGLLLSNVKLEKRTHIPGGNEFIGIANEQDVNQELAGMVVWNTNVTKVDFPDGAGAYVWDGDNWIYLRKGSGGGNGGGSGGGGSGGGGEADSLPKVIITYTVYCGGVTFTITRPATGWTDAEWNMLNPANSNVFALLSGNLVTGTWKKESSTSYSYTIVNPSTVSQTATITVAGVINNKTIETETKSVSVPGNSGIGNSNFKISGIDCFDVRQTGDLTGRIQADFTKTYDYVLSGAPPSGAYISVVDWSYTNPMDAVESFTPSNAGGSHKVTVKFSQSLLTKLAGNKAGISVVITATVLVKGSQSCSGGEIYTVSFPISIRDADCCGTAVDYEGHIYTAKRFGTQCWMTQNLRSVLDNKGNLIDPSNGTSWIDFITMNPGLHQDGGLKGRTAIIMKWDYANKKIKYDLGDLVSTSYATPAYYENGNKVTLSLEEYANKFGFLYTSQTVVNNSNICPDGWRVPSREEVNILSAYLGTDASKKIRANNFKYNAQNRNSPTSYLLWDGYDPGHPNNSGFNLLPIGLIDKDSNLNLNRSAYFNLYGGFWTRTRVSELDPYIKAHLVQEPSRSYINGSYSTGGAKGGIQFGVPQGIHGTDFPVRCLK